jgi:hypothetical protein
MTLKPVSFTARVKELTLERWIIEDPELVGEPLLVLGCQLAEFEEDKDRLDVLALDQYGELVLIELKVSDDFRVTDLQALAYAGAYAKRTPEQLARTLRNHLNRQAAQAPPTGAGSGTAPATASENTGDGELTESDLGTPALADAGATEAPTAPVEHTLDEAKTRIVEFLQLDDFGQWSPSQHVRIKLVAPDFPKRVLQTVKWLGDVYEMPIEAINARLFESAPAEYSIAFERLLPLATDDEFDLTVRDREDKQREQNITRRPAVLPLLIQNGTISHGQELWLTPSALTKQYAHHYDANNPAFRVRVHAPDGEPVKMAWKADEDSEEELLAPSVVVSRVWNAVIPDYSSEDWSTPVATTFAVEPGGKTLDQLAEETGAW